MDSNFNLRLFILSLNLKYDAKTFSPFPILILNRIKWNPLNFLFTFHHFFFKVLLIFIIELGLNLMEIGHYDHKQY